MRWPLHGYLMAKIANNIIGPEENISRGTLSTLLARLERAGLVEQVGAGASPVSSNHDARVYAITPAGKKHFERLMLEIPDRPGAYSRIFHIKALHLDLLPHEKSLELVEHYLHYCIGVVRSKEADIADFSSSPEKQKYTGDPHLRETASGLMRLKVGQWKQEVEWVQRLREEVGAWINADQNGPRNADQNGPRNADRGTRIKTDR